MGNLISASRISVIRDGKTILADVSLGVGEHDFVTIIGPNGAGKSMLLKCIMGFYKADSGTVTRKRGLKIGYIPQRLAPDHTIPIKTGRFVTLRKTASGVALAQVAKETKIEGFLDKPLHVLSGGELQRVLLARALLDTPDLLVLDEPAQNLDVSGQLSFYRLLDKVYAERKVGILMVSHDLHLVMSSTKRVVCLYHHVCCSGAPHMVTRDPEFTALFGDDMARLMAVYHHSHDHNHTHDHGGSPGHSHEHGHSNRHEEARDGR